ncbi:hypothetical protein ACFVY4_19730 [Streptomyces sp. NPDC058299]|uniref:hypothetical protein n=1 Tax=Streptomyces sp. NPDC058299 TaxID=3346435 RepID=UPI0036ECEEFE
MSIPLISHNTPTVCHRIQAPVPALAVQDHRHPQLPIAGELLQRAVAYEFVLDQHRHAVLRGYAVSAAGDLINVK